MDAAPIVAKIEEIQREIDERLDSRAELPGSVGRVDESTEGIIEILTDMAEGRATEAEIRSKLQSLSDGPSDMNS